MFSGRTCVLSTVIGYLLEACVDKGAEKWSTCTWNIDFRIQRKS